MGSSTNDTPDLAPATMPPPDLVTGLSDPDVETAPSSAGRAPQTSSTEAGNAAATASPAPADSRGTSSPGLSIGTGPTAGVIWGPGAIGVATLLRMWWSAQSGNRPFGPCGC